MPFEESLRLSIALGLTIFLVLLRFDSDRILRSDYFRYRYPWIGPLSYYGLVIAFAIGIAVILPNGRGRLFLTPGDPELSLQIMLLFSAVGVLTGLAFAFRWYGAITPLPTALLPSRLIGTAASAVADELQFRSIVLGMLIFADLPGGVGTAIVIQALLYGLAQRRLWRERQWFFLIASVLLGYAAGQATVAAGSVVPAIVGHFAVMAALFAFAGGRLRTRPI
ncbi:MAG TPA: CPBP family glutamic-type intramembrane protease [Candidatus Limnocylindria bacterium]|nr:CPBP family glutamic-type intramembrane protease [Candidatus Limnocylindria bacterium]